MKMFLSIITTNLNWETLTRNQLLLKDEMRLKREKFIIMWAYWKIHFLGKGEVIIKLIYKGELPKKEACTVCRFKGGGLR